MDDRIRQRLKPEEACDEQALVIAPGTIIDNRYEIISLLGIGAMGAVYKARHTVLETIFAVKFIHPQRMGEDSLKRFQLEGKAANMLNHPNIVGMHDFGVTPEGLPYISMEYLEGKSLDSVLKDEGVLNRQEFFNIFEQVCSALFHAHEQGVLHRDLKPANIFLCASDSGQDLVKIVDFGLAKLLPRNDGAEQPRITLTGEVLGSPLYMSPEQCIVAKLDQRSDIYTVGVVMYESLTGKQIFNGRTPAEIMNKHIHSTPQFDSDAAILKGLQDLVLKCLNKEPSRRFQTADEIRLELKKLKIDDQRASAEFQDILAGKTKPGLPAGKLSPLLRLALLVLTVTVVVLAGISIAANNIHPAAKHRLSD